MSIPPLGFDLSKTAQIRGQIQRDLKRLPHQLKLELFDRVFDFFRDEGIDFPDEDKEIWVELAMSAYASSREIYAPVTENWAKSLLDRAAKDGKKLVFLARDGLAPYLVAQKLQQSDPKYVDVKMCYAYISRKVAFDAAHRTVDGVPLLQKYMEQLGIEKDDDCLMVDIGFGGSMISTIKRDLRSLTGNIDFEFLVSKTPNASGFVGDLEHPLQALRSAGGNPATHWMEDMHQGIIKSPSKLVVTSDGQIVPNVLVGKGPDTCRETRPIDYMVRFWALQGVLDGVSNSSAAASMEMTAAKTKEVFDQFLLQLESRERLHLIKHDPAENDTQRQFLYVDPERAHLENAAKVIQRRFRMRRAMQQMNHVAAASLAERRALIDESVARAQSYSVPIAADPAQPLVNLEKSKDEMDSGPVEDGRILDRLKPLVERKRRDDLKRIAKLVSYEKFVAQLKRTFRDTLADIMSSPTDKRSYIIIADHEGKSANWVAAHLHDLMSVHPPEDIVSRYEMASYLESHPDVQHVVMIDDGIYSGEQSSRYIRSMNSEVFRNRKFHVSIPFMSKAGANVVRTALEAKLQRIGCVSEEYAQHVRFADHIPMFSMREFHRMGDISERHWREYQRQFTGNGLTDKLDRTLVWMAHKSADSTSNDTKIMEMATGGVEAIEPYKPEKRVLREEQIRSLIPPGQKELNQAVVKFIQSNRGNFIVASADKQVKLFIDGVSIPFGGRNGVQQWKLEEGQQFKIEEEIDGTEMLSIDEFVVEDGKPVLLLSGLL